MYLLKISLRNLKRNKLRSLISVLAIAAVVTIVIFSRSLMMGFTDSIFNFYIDNQTGHVSLADFGYRLREALMPLDYSVNGFEGEGLSAMVSGIKGIEKVEHVLPRLNFGAISSVEGRMVRMAGVGVDVKAEESYGALTSDIIRGRMPDKGSEILVGSGLLEKLNADVGSRVTMMISDLYRSLRGRTFEVTGVRESGVAHLDDNYFYLPLESAQEILFMYDEASELLIYGGNRNQGEFIAGEVNALAQKYSAEDRYSVLLWREADPTIELLEATSGTMNIVYVFFILLGTVVLATTMTMIVRERTHEIGMMAALGLTKMQIMKVFTLEGAFKGIAGSLLGVIGGGLITLHYSVYGIHVEALIDVVKETEILMDPVMYTPYSFENLAVSFIISVIIVTLVCLYPAWQAASLEPVDALHD